MILTKDGHCKMAYPRWPRLGPQYILRFSNVLSTSPSWGINKLYVNCTTVCILYSSLREKPICIGSCTRNMYSKVVLCLMWLWQQPRTLDYRSAQATL